MIAQTFARVPTTAYSDAPSRRSLRAALDAVRSGARPSRAEAELLLAAREAELDELLEVAGALRDKGLVSAGRPGVITYSRKVFIPLTHLCQDRCHYCVFVQTPAKLAKAGIAPYLSEQEILRIAREGAALGCKEALFTLGDRPENRWSVAREWLTEHGYESTLEYMRAMAILVLEETGLLPHLNPGVMTWSELQRLKPAAPSMGMMLETTSSRLWSEKGQPHFGSPDKDPAVRLQVLEDAGRASIPFTTGVLLGIGENRSERIDAIEAIHGSHAEYGHIQEVIVQNFRAKYATAMMHSTDLPINEYAAAVAVTRLLLGSEARVQAPPNLTDPEELALLIRAGIDDWGGVSPLTPDHVNPERPWPQIESLARLTELSGFQLRERLTAYPPYITGPGPWIDPSVLPHTLALANSSGLADLEAQPIGRPWRLETSIGDTAEWGTDAVLYSQAEGMSPPARREASRIDSLMAEAGRDPAGLDDDDYVELLSVDGAALEVLARIADGERRERVGDAVTYVVNRNLDASLLGDRLDLELASELADEAVAMGATEMCLQGKVSTALPVSMYEELVSAVRGNNRPLHVHAYRPIELVDGARRAGVSLEEHLRRLRHAGVNSIPGTGARILDDGVRSRLSGGSELGVADWIATVEAAHRAGLHSSATMVYGHIESPRHQVAHLRALAAMQSRTGGFTEFIAMPYIPQDSPVVLRGARPGPDIRETRAIHAVARLMLAGSIDHVQAAWTKIGLRGSRLVLSGGADDLGGTLLDGRLAPWAGPEAGRVLGVNDMRRVANELGRPLVERTTTYGEVLK